MAKFESNTGSFLRKLQDLKINIDGQKTRILKDYNKKNTVLSILLEKYKKNINGDDGILEVEMNEITALAKAANGDLTLYNDVIKQELKVADLHFKTIQHEDSKQFNNSSNGENLELGNVSLNDELLMKIHEEMEQSKQEINKSEKEIDDNIKTYEIE
jgi:hypothetical protein